MISTLASSSSPANQASNSLVVFTGHIILL
jgi:hypothetical protein